jgi:hypothetical protein
MYDESRVDVVNVPRTPCIFVLSCGISPIERYTLSAALLKGSFRTRWPEAA